MKQNIATTWQIGQATVTRIEELLGPAFRPEELLATWDPAVLEEHGHWMAPNFYVPSTNQFIMSVHSWLIRTPHHNILVDTCCGNAKNRPGSPHFHQLDTPYLDRLRARRHRLCPMHASPRRPRRLEYPIARRPLGADVSEREICLFPRRAELLGPRQESESARGAARRLYRLRAARDRREARSSREHDRPAERQPSDRTGAGTFTRPDYAPTARWSGRGSLYRRCDA